MSEKEARVSWSEYSADHIIPWIAGGKTTVVQGQVLCHLHNSLLGARVNPGNYSGRKRTCYLRNERKWDKLLIRFQRFPKSIIFGSCAISHNYGTDAEKVLDELFQRIALTSPNVELVRMVDEGALEAERKFNIPETTRRPVLIITQVHPNDWKAVNDECLVISLGSISDEDVLRDFCSNLAE